MFARGLIVERTYPFSSGTASIPFKTGEGNSTTGVKTRFWIIEVPALPLSMFGIGVYFVILGATIFATVFATVASMLILAAFLNMVRRYLELQIFATEPDDHDFRARLLAATRRRTRNVVPRDE